MERLRDEDGKFRARTYEVTVWNTTNGDVEYYHGEATWDEAKEIEANWDEPFYEVQIEEND